jgi:hypothetical protein
MAPSSFAYYPVPLEAAADSYTVDEGNNPPLRGVSLTIASAMYVDIVADLSINFKQLSLTVFAKREQLGLRPETPMEERKVQHHQGPSRLRKPLPGV